MQRVVRTIVNPSSSYTAQLVPLLKVMQFEPPNPQKWKLPSPWPTPTMAGRGQNKKSAPQGACGHTPQNTFIHSFIHQILTQEAFVEPCVCLALGVPGVRGQRSGPPVPELGGSMSIGQITPGSLHLLCHQCECVCAHRSVWEPPCWGSFSR